MVLHQGTFQDTGKGAVGEINGGAAGATGAHSEGIDYGGIMMSWSRSI